MAFLVLIIYTISLFIRPHEWGVLINEESSLIRNTLLLCMVFFLFSKNKNLNSPQLIMMVFMLIAVFASLASSGWLGGAMTYGEAFLRTAFIPFLLVSGIVDTVKKQYLMFFTVIGASLIMVVNGHVQVTSENGLGLVGNPYYLDGQAIRITYLGYFSDPNDLGMLFAMTLPLLFLIKLKTPVLLRFVVWACVACILYGIYLTNSRGTLLATLSLFGFWFWRTYGTKKSVLLGVLISPALLFVLSRFRTISAEDSSSQGRLDAWYQGYQMLVSNPIFGVGQAQFMDYHTHTAHNSFVLAFAEMGLFGCLIWVGLLTVSVVGLINIAQNKFVLPEPTESTGTSNQKANLDAGSKLILNGNGKSNGNGNVNGNGNGNGKGHGNGNSKGNTNGNGKGKSCGKIDVMQQSLQAESLIAIALLYCLIAYMVSGFFLSRTYVPVLYLYLGMASACFGRVSRILPKNMPIFDTQQVAKISGAVTVGGIFAVYLLIKVAL